MSETHDPNALMGAAQDIAPLAWVIDEIRSSLTQTLENVKIFLGAKQNLDALKNARTQIHQANGALQLLDLRGVAMMTEAIEQLLQRWENEPKECLPAAVRSLDTAATAVIAYLEGLLSGRPNQPIRLYPYYQDILKLSQAARVHPADLVFPDLSRRPAFHQIESRSLTPDQLRLRRARFEEGLLGFLRNSEDPKSRRLMYEAMADIEQLPQRGLARSFWWIVRGLLDALQADKVPTDVDLKRVLARLNLQLQRLIEGSAAVAERLMIDSLYYVGRADESLPRVAEVKRLYGLAALMPPDFERATLTAVDADAMRLLKDALTQAKTLWGHLVGGSGAELAKFEQELGLAADAAKRLDAATLVQLLQSLSTATREFNNATPAIREGLGLEVASALLFAELAVDELPHVDPEFETRAAAVKQRLAIASRGQPLPDSAPWMSELARRAQDRLTMGSVVDETQASLREIEQRLDRFFRNPADRSELSATDNMFDQVCGVLSVLGFEDPVAALRQVQVSVRRFSNPASQPEPEEFARIAQNLGAVGFFVESLTQDSEQPRSMFSYDPTTGMFSADLGQPAYAESISAAEDLRATRDADESTSTAALHERSDNIEASAAQHLQDALLIAQRLSAAPTDAAAMQALERLLPALIGEADLLDDAALKQQSQQATQLFARFQDERSSSAAQALVDLFTPQSTQVPVQPSAPLPTSQAAADKELHDIFIEEANEVLDGVAEQLAALRVEPNDPATLTTARRAFHTLKGSSRMVGLRNFGEAAWGVEQCFNLWLAQERAANEDLLQLAEAASRLMRDWISQIALTGTDDIDVAGLVQAAQKVREGSPFEYLGAQPTEVEPAELSADSLSLSLSPKLEGSVADSASSALPDTHLQAADAETTDFDLDFDPALLAEQLQVTESDAQPQSDVEPNLLAEPEADQQEQEQEREPSEVTSEDESVRKIGPIEISHALYSVFLNEADECIRVLGQEVSEWRFEPTRPVANNTLRRAHSLAGIAGTVGLTPVWELADMLEDLLFTLARNQHPTTALLEPEQFDVVTSAIERMRGMMHQFAAGVYPNAATEQADALRALLSLVNSHLSDLAEQHAQLATRLEVVSNHTEDAATDLSDSKVHAVEPATTQALATDLTLDAVNSEQSEARTEASTPLASLVDEQEVAPSPAAALSVDHNEYVSDATIDSPPSAVSSVESNPIPNDQASLISLPTKKSAVTSISPATSSLNPVSLMEEPAVDIEQDDDEAEPTTGTVASKLRDEIDADLLDVFVTEANDLLPAIAANLRGLTNNPRDREVARDLMRQFHTVKGSARMAGAMRLGELVHEMETRIESAMQLDDVPAPVIDELQGQYDQALALFDELQRPQVAQSAAPVSTLSSVATHAAQVEANATPSASPRAEVIDIARARPPAEAPRNATPASFIRVRADVLDKLVDQAGEVSIARSKLENEVGTLKTSLTDLTENISRLRAQLREVEIQADAQISARADQLAKESAAFDPLEYDRYTRLQELTRLLAESVEDVALVQNNMLKGLSMADVDLTSQSRLTRELQQQLMRVRLVPFSNVSERLYRVARQAAKELDKRVTLEIRGGNVEIDRGVLERMAAPFEHLVRNSIVHGLEKPAQRVAAGKSDSGEITIEVRQEGNEIIVVFADNGAGLNLPRIHERGLEKGLLYPNQAVSDRDLMELIFAPGFSTATEVTELAGRGVGMDVVRAELSSFGGRIAVASEAGQGTRFTLYLPLTLAVTQVVLANIGARRYAIPAGMVEQVRRYKPSQLAPSLLEGFIDIPPIGQVVLRPLAQLLGEEMSPLQGKQTPVVLLRSGDDRLSVAVDEVSSNQEVVVKNVGAHVSRLAGILGATILGNGEIVLIINPVQLITRAPEPLQALTVNSEEGPGTQGSHTLRDGAPVVMVVDDSLTVRRVTQRLLDRNGYQVMLAKDGVDALRQMQDRQPDIMLVDIEMPRMDGYDLTRNVRGAAQTQEMPIIMITSRTAEKHRRMAFEIGVNEYLGKPYQEDELLAHIRRYLAQRVTA